MTWGFIDGRVYVPERKGDIPYGWDWLINALEAGGELYYKGKILYKKENTMKIEAQEVRSVKFLTQEEFDEDIVEEWIDFDWSCLPAWADMYIAMDKNGDWASYPDSPVLDIEEEVWDTGGYFILLPTDYFPKGFTGDWTESLMKNPKYTKK